MLDVPSANAKTAAINSAFAGVGNTATGTRMPPTRKNSEPLAWEYHVASQLLRTADARRKKAHGACVKAGVMFDPEKEPMAIGTQALVYAGDVVEISVSVTTPTSKIDYEAVFAALEKKGIKLAVINALVLKHTTENRAPHKFTTSLVTR